MKTSEIICGFHVTKSMDVGTIIATDTGCFKIIQELIVPNFVLNSVLDPNLRVWRAIRAYGPINFYDVYHIEASEIDRIVGGPPSKVINKQEVWIQWVNSQKSY